MGYGSKSLNELRDECLSIAVAHQFTDATPGEDVALMHTELSEAMEDIRDGVDLTAVWYEEKVPLMVSDIMFMGEGQPDRQVVMDGKPMWRTIRHDHPYPKLPGGGWDVNHPYKPCGVPSEMADELIRVLHFCGKHHIDIERVFREKMAYNETRPIKHGRKL